MATPESTTDDHDPYLWLEEVEGTEALAWVRSRNSDTFGAYTDDAGFTALRERLREVLDADDRIPFVRRRGEYLYNFWRDAANPRGVWRRTTLADYRAEHPRWEILVDVDALAAREGENWVWKGATVLRPGHHRALVSLSRGGADATVVREFDLCTRDFLAGDDVFELPEAKSIVSWIDEDSVYVGTDFGPGSLTTSGYPRMAKHWRRGTPLSQAHIVAEGEPEDVALDVVHDPTPGFERSIVERSTDFFHSEWSVFAPGSEPRRLPIPSDARPSLHREWLLVRTRSSWTVGGTEYPDGSLLAITLDAFLAGDRAVTPLFVPDEHSALDDYAWTHGHLLVATLTDVRCHLELLTPPAAGPAGGPWQRGPLPGTEGTELDSVGIVATDPDGSDEYFLEVSGFTRPGTLLRGDAATPDEPERLKRSPEFFAAEGVRTAQYFAVSEDGTRIPYFVVRPDSAGDGPGPALLRGYGGFEISQTPAYSPILGRGWLARGGTYVVANIRGGGEYGPSWHTCAMRENRPLAYADFAAVASDLVARGITTPGMLGALGGSNGGLLTGVMVTRYPERFGAVVSRVPLLDMRRYHLLHAGASWMAEYGDPDDAGDWAFLRRYSPYHNVGKDRTYPPTLVLTSTRDDRVHPGHARKMVARLLENGHDVHYYENTEGGHAGSADNDQLAFAWALILEFLWRRLG